MEEKFLILDSNSILHRSFHALPPLTTKKGEMVNAVYGFLLVLFKVIREIQPNYIAACFDFPAKTFRHKKFKDYKATRPPLPKDLASQIPKLKEVLLALNIPFFEKEGFEADDVISTIVNRVKNKVSEIYILSGDFDTLQLVNKKIKVQILTRGIKEPLIFDEKKVFEKFGILPRQIPDFKAIVGDQSDNIPGLPGIGPKTAVQILKDFNNLENFYEKIENSNLKEKNKKIFLENKEKVFLFRDLAKLKSDLDLEFEIKRCLFGKFDLKRVEGVLKKFEFYSLLKRIPEILGTTRKLF